MVKPTAQEKLDQYRKVLARYEAEGDPKLQTQRILVAKLEQEVRNAGSKRR